MRKILIGLLMFSLVVSSAAGFNLYNQDCPTSFDSVTTVSDKAMQEYLAGNISQEELLAGSTTKTNLHNACD